MSTDSALQIIRRRRSCRSYDERPLEPGLRAQVEALAAGQRVGPFGCSVRLALLDAADAQRKGAEKLGTYGVIRGAPHYVAGAVVDAPRALEDFGFVFEALILELTALDLGTCWLGGTFRRGAFAAALQAGPADVIPAVTPVGHPAARFNPADSFFRWAAGSNRRKPWAELFFDESFGRPLTQEQAGPHAEVLEMVRLGPSASNRQPWRIVRDPRRAVLHLFLQRTPGYAAAAPTDLQRVDMGIAMCHLESSARALGLTGRWLVQPPDLGPLPERTTYVASWVEGTEG